MTSPTYRFCRTEEGTIGRRTVLGVADIDLAGERYDSKVQRWILDYLVLDDVQFPQLDEEEVRGSHGDAADLPNADRTIPDRDGRAAEGRCAWLDEAIANTWSHIDNEVQSVEAELPFARPGSWDYDYEIDKIAEIKAAYGGLEALCNERRLIDEREQRRKKKVYDD